MKNGLYASGRARGYPCTNQYQPSQMEPVSSRLNSIFESGERR